MCSAHCFVARIFRHVICRHMQSIFNEPSINRLAYIVILYQKSPDLTVFYHNFRGMAIDKHGISDSKQNTRRSEKFRCHWIRTWTLVSYRKIQQIVQFNFRSILVFNTECVYTKSMISHSNFPYKNIFEYPWGKHEPNWMENLISLLMENFKGWKIVKNVWKNHEVEIYFLSPYFTLIKSVCFHTKFCDQSFLFGSLTADAVSKA